ncbi:MAG TPA: hypothetical protein VFA18_00055 [Gemmataceae bacterium]|nr:hypothetical protein [Gemmataceae bacterium]
MRGRIGFLMPAGLFALLAFPLPAHAHRLVADYSVLSGRRVQVESWFDPTGNNARAAKVQVLRADGTVLAAGTMSDQGVFVFAYDRAEPLKVVVSAGKGHRAEVQIPESELQAPASGKATAPASSEAHDSNSLQPGPPRLSHRPRETWNDILTGIGFLLALAAFVLSVRNSRTLRKLEATGQTSRATEDNLEMRA